MMAVLALIAYVPPLSESSEFRSAWVAIVLAGLVALPILVPEARASGDDLARGKAMIIDFMPSRSSCPIFRSSSLRVVRAKLLMRT